MSLNEDVGKILHVFERLDRKFLKLKDIFDLKARSILKLSCI